MAASAKPTVVEALSAVMDEVQSVRKSDRNTHQNYNFRGVDAVVNAVGPALRKHGVIVVPTGAVCESEHYQTAKGVPMRGVTLTVSFRFYGPAGDSIEATVCGEASDSGDKAVPKAHSVAYRTLLLEALCVPTDEPDPDSQSHERGNAAAATNGNGGAKATAAQVREIEKLIAELHAADTLTEPQVRDGMKAAYGTEVTAELNRTQAAELAQRLAAKAGVA